MSLPALRPNDPAEIGYPPTLPVELALRTAPVADICAAYGIDREQWETLKQDPVFRHELAVAVEMVKKEGMSFKLKARLQSEELLKTSWKMIHSPSDEVPPSVKADLLKFTVRAAGLDGSNDKTQANNANNFQININLG